MPHGHRFALAAVLIGCLLSPNSAPRAATPTNTAAYDMAIKCFVASGHKGRVAKNANNGELAAHYDGLAKQAFGVAKILGKALGYSADRIDADINGAIDSELPRMRDAQYLENTEAECKAYGLM